MIPTLLLAAVLVGLLAPTRTAVAAGVVLAAAWGAIVGVADARLATLVAGTVLGLANVAVGMVVGRLGRAAARVALR